MNDVDVRERSAHALTVRIARVLLKLIIPSVSSAFVQKNDINPRIFTQRHTPTICFDNFSFTLDILSFSCE